MRIYKNILRMLYHRLLLDWTKHLRKELTGCNTVLDLGCGYDSPIRYCNVPFSVGVELFEPYFLKTKEMGTHNQYIKADVRKMELRSKSFDAVIAINLLEHLPKEEGYTLIKKMETWAIKKVIIGIPNGYVYQNGFDNNPLQEHRCGWSTEELRNLGFKVYGKDGWKKLKGYRGHPKYKPALLWQIISDLTQKVICFYPELAFQLSATKEIGKETI